MHDDDGRTIAATSDAARQADFDIGDLVSVREDGVTTWLGKVTEAVPGGASADGPTVCGSPAGSSNSPPAARSSPYPWDA